MASALMVAIVKFSLLALLWVFVIAAFRVVRNDLAGAAATRTPVPAAAAAPARPGAPPAAPTPAAPAAPRGRSASRSGGGRSAARKIVVTEGSLAGTTVSLGEAPVTLGRADDSTLVLTDDYASTRHARLVPGEGAWVLEDLGSTNGTYLGATKVSSPVPVPIGQPIRIGKTVLELRR